MQKVSYRRHRFPTDIIHHAVWLFFRFPLSYRDVEDLLAERGIDLTYDNGAALGAEVWAGLCPQAETTATLAKWALAPG